MVGGSKPMLAGYWKTIRVSTKVHVSYNLSASFLFKKYLTKNLPALVLGF